MADYAATVTTMLQNAERIGKNIGIYAGKYNLTNYNTTLVTQTAITKFFRVSGVSGFTQGILSVIPTGVSDNGHTFEWDYTTGAFKAYKPTNIVMNSDVSTGATVLALTGQNAAVHATSAVGNIIGTALEAASNVDCGEVGFIAIGLI